MKTDRQYAQHLDEKDPLRIFREKFIIEDPDLIYLDGNSLGRMPKLTQNLISELGMQWGKRLIRMWGDGYFHISQHIGSKIARLVGAKPEEVIIAESTSVNLFKLVVAALKAQPGRTKIITDDLNFPSDIYVLNGVINLLGGNHVLEIVSSSDGVHGPVDEISRRIDDQTALVTLSHTVFKSAFTYEMAVINQAAHEAGALTLWDLSHSAGSVPIALTETEADLAIGCTYKYINGGPGSPAFLFVRNELQKRLNNPITGWMSQKNQFDFEYGYDPLPGIDQFLTGTPPVMSIAPIEVGVDILLEAGMDRIRLKSVQQTEYLIALWQELLRPYGFSLNSPTNFDRRGSHISIGHPEGWRINQCMIQEMRIIPDFRAPDNIRLGITPLYTTFVELHTAVSRIQQIMEDRLYEKYSDEKTTVT